MVEISIHQAKVHFSKLLSRVAAGEEIVITKAGKPVARLVPFQKPKKKRIPGQDKGKVWIAEDFDAPLPADIQKLLE